MEENRTYTAQGQTETPVQSAPPPVEQPTKFCKFCGGKIPADAVLCTLCGRQVETPAAAAEPRIVIKNQNTNGGAFMESRKRSKWAALALCFFLGALGAHKFYEGKVRMGILYILTLGLFGIGVVIDFICLLFKPNPYYV